MIFSLSNKKLQFALALGIPFLVYFLAPQSMGEAARRICFIFSFAALFWAFEIIPLFATSLLVVVLEVLLLCRPGGVLGMDQSGYQIFLVPFGSPVIILFFGGFVLAAAMQKYHVDQLIAEYLLKIFGTKPYFLMLGFMVTTAFLSMWMSNTATAAMMLVMVKPILSQLKQNDPFKIALILAITFAANIGGIGTPVGTPPNAIAIGVLANQGIHLSFVGWMKMAIPLAVLLLAVLSVLLTWMYPAKEKRIMVKVASLGLKTVQSRWTLTIAACTVLLWLTSEWHKIPSSIVSLIAAGAFLTLGLLNKDDLKNIEWDVLVLMWGGLALGEGMAVSGFTDWVVHQPLFQQKGAVLVGVFCLLSVVLSTFMSNTATANLMVPVVMAIPGENNVLLAITVALCCSFAMALPVSTPPNAIAFSTNMIKGKDMFKAGLLVSVISVILILLGYNFMITRAFNLP